MERFVQSFVLQNLIGTQNQNQKEKEKTPKQNKEVQEKESMFAASC